ncbi:hypothetical protein IU451_29255 [Nocardia cyriacigeorgica]|uniref:hypothetical protein n=1 Tax=Nocardia cyriacigeorgica TaxID=135487 RepID=UPI001893DA0C|nr:hypothetical protein [Nocardia cyriacigeorgica]MBF6326589.1 hypothetical protein [Nocardia cyriacigeorgica]
MAYTPERLVSPAGIEVLAGSAVERETLLGRGYRRVEPKPAPAVKAPAARPEPAREAKTSK